MKKIVSLIISSCLLLGLVFFAYPSCDVEAAPSLSDYWEEYYDYIADGYASGNFLNGIGRQLVAGIVTPIRYYTDPNFGSGTKADPFEVTSSPVSNPQPIIKYDSVNNDLRTYNYETNNYETITNIYRSTNVNYTEGYEYVITTENNNYYYNFENTYYSLNQSVSTPDYGEYYQVYYELPDGRSSYNLTPQDIHGLVFNYDTILYDYNSLDPSIIGAFHLDGSVSNVIAPTLTVTGSTANPVNGRFDGGFTLPYLGANVSSSSVFFSIGSLYLPVTENPNRTYTIEYWKYEPTNGTIIDTVSFNGSTVSLKYSGSHSGWHHYRYAYSNGNCLGVWTDGVYASSSAQIVDLFNTSSNGVVYYKIGPVSATYYDRYSSGGIVTTKYVNNIYDEVVIYKGLHGTIGQNFDVRQQPFDLPFAFTRPEGVPSTLALKSHVNPGNVQYGGVRPIEPNTGDVFLNIDENRITSIQQYFNGIWNEIDGAFYSGDLWIDARKFNISSLMLLPDDIISTVSLLDRILSKLDEIKSSLSSGGSGGNQFEQFDPSDPKNETFPYDPNVTAPDGSGFSPLDFLLVFLYLLMALIIVIKVFDLFLGFVGYLFTLISIPASTLLFETSEKFSYLDENGLSRNYIQDVFGVLKGEVHFGLEEPLYAVNIGNVQITFFTFMVMLFQMVIIGGILYYVHSKTSSIDVPKWRE